MIYYTIIFNEGSGIFEGSLKTIHKGSFKGIYKGSGRGFKGLGLF